ncbi:hypothetical protein PR048_025549, partial [Dryococelus australis]
MKKEMEVEDLFEPLQEHRSDYLGDCFERVAEPIFLGRLIRYFEPGSDMSEQQAYLNALGLLGCCFINVLVRQPVSMAMAHMGMKLRVATCSLIYRKSLRLSQTAASEATVGQIVNLMSNDTTRFENSIILLPYLVVGPAQALIVTYFIWDSMGISAVFGMFAILIFIPLQ